MYRVFSHDVTAAILVSQNNETAAMLVSQTSPVGVELFSYGNAFFCSNKFAWMLATWVKTLYTVFEEYFNQTARKLSILSGEGSKPQENARVSPVHRWKAF